jgi:hypothetical protein
LTPTSSARDPGACLEPDPANRETASPRTTIWEEVIEKWATEKESCCPNPP